MAHAPDMTGSASELRIVLGQLIRRLRSEHRFPISHAAVLSRLDREGPKTTSALAAAERVRPQSMAQTIADLQADRMVGRRPDPIDRRCILIELTEHGRETLREDRRRREGWLAEAIATQLNDAERQTLNDAVPLLQRLTQS